MITINYSFHSMAPQCIKIYILSFLCNRSPFPHFAAVFQNKVLFQGASASDVFEERTASGREKFIFLTRLNTTTFVLLSLFSLSVRDRDVLACRIFISGWCPWLKKISCEAPY